ncbi:MAG TPA: methyltransferase domain-containing protein [Verrucomicrobiae bacterium]|nr:methyltransferase domain-containing protein [Verrucomicrobiae bacterium]
MATPLSTELPKGAPVHRVRRLAVADSRKQRWQSAVPEEVAYWEGWCKTKGLKWKDDFEFRFQPDTELGRDITNDLDIPSGGTLHLLDVGAGPATSLGKRWEGHTVELTAVDPLADHYNALLSRYGLTPPVPTSLASAETLVNSFPLNHFDVVHARNSIDHSLDAPQAVDQMLAVAKSGGWVILAHSISEATAAENNGFHTWNFFTHDGDFIIEKYGGEQINITRRYAGIAQVACDAMLDKRWLTVRMKKLVASVAGDSESTPVEVPEALVENLTEGDVVYVLSQVQAAFDSLNQSRYALDQIRHVLSRCSSPNTTTGPRRTQHSVETLPAVDEGLRARADAHYGNADWAEAGRHYQELTRHYRDDVEIWRRWRDCARRQGHKVLANLILGDALRIHPEWKHQFEEPLPDPTETAAADLVCR